MKHKAKNEISHEELDKNEDKTSGRYVKIGSKQQAQIKSPDGKTQNVPFILQDKVIYEINVCPYCDSKATFHRRIQESRDITGNVWRVEQFLGEKGYDFRKFDYCLDCRKEFLIELYIWKKEEDLGP